MTRLSPIIVALLVVAAAVVAASASARAAAIPPSTVVSFWRPDRGSFVVPAAGGVETRVSTASAITWSPDGRRVAGGFVDRKRCRLQVVDLATAKHTTVKENCSMLGNVDWSPDGTRIAFAAGEHIFVAFASGAGKPTKITDGLNDQYPRWSPDGQRISYSILLQREIIRPDGVHIPRTAAQVVTVAPNGSDERPLTAWANENDQSRTADWSPDGTRVVFESERDEWLGFVVGELYVMNADGSNVQRLTTSPGYDGQPAWSPDGSQIAFVSRRDGARIGDTWVMNADGSNQHRIAAGGVFPSWVPAGASMSIR